MNKRIRELLEQTDIPLFPLFENQPPAWVATDHNMEKFAELIVRECVDFLKDTLDDHFAAEQLEEHFGIKDDNV